MKQWLETLFGKRRPFLSLWLAVGSLFALSMILGASTKRTALDGLAWLGTTFGIPQGYADWIAGVQGWFDEHQVFASNVLGVLIGIGIFALILHGNSSVKPSGPAAATLIVAWGIAQETGVTGWWWISAVVLPLALLVTWWLNQDERDRESPKELGERLLLAIVELVAVVISLPIMIYSIFYTLRSQERS